MIEICQAPQEYQAYSGDPAVFLAGGISSCPNWQQLLLTRLSQEAFDKRCLVLNPRRDDFQDTESFAQRQIAWEFEALRRAQLVVFWFPNETLCPITLYELGAWSMTDKALVIGIHPEYKRGLDVLVQTQLARPELSVARDFSAFQEAVVAAIRSLTQTSGSD